MTEIKDIIGIKNPMKIKFVEYGNNQFNMSFLSSLTMNPRS